VVFLLDKGIAAEKYNIVGEKEVSNLAIAQFIARILDKDLNYKLMDFHSKRPGHDLRYGLDGSRLREMGFSLPKTFEQSLEKTIQWYIDNPKWLEW
jgi:dTDP-D-glucose 4,6-dehydratase